MEISRGKIGCLAIVWFMVLGIIIRACRGESFEGLGVLLHWDVLFFFAFVAIIAYGIYEREKEG
jgi:hypothetical protein